MMLQSGSNWAARVVTILTVGALLTFTVLPLVGSDYTTFFIAQLVPSAYLAVSFSLAYSYSKVLSFAQGMFFGLSGYVAIYLMSSAPWSLPLVLLASVGAAALLGLLVGAVLIRMDNHGATVSTVILATAAFLAGNALSQFTGGEDGIRSTTKTVGVGAWQVVVGTGLDMYFLLGAPLLAIVLGMWAMRRSTVWTLLRAVAMNEVRAELLGFNVARRRLAVFVLSAAIAGLGGASYALFIGHVTTSVLEIGLSVNAILWTILGGAGTAFGPLIGVLLVYPLTELVAAVFLYVQIFIGVLLVVVAIGFPKGIIGSLNEVAESHRGGPGRSALLRPRPV